MKSFVRKKQLRLRSGYVAAAAGLVLVSCLLVSAAGIRTRPPEIPFAIHTLDVGSAEAATVADIDGDGRLDIVAGEYWYEAPKWTQHHFRELFYANNYIEDFIDVGNRHR